MQTLEERKQKKAARARKWYNENIELAREKQNKRRDKNRAAYNKYRNDYRTKNARGIFDVLKQSSKKRNIDFLLNRDSFELWYNSTEKKCFYCERTEEEVLKTDAVMQTKCNRLTIDRVENSIGYLEDNLVLCCKRCNSIKGDFFSKDEMLEIGKIIKNKKTC